MSTSKPIKILVLDKRLYTTIETNYLVLDLHFTLQVKRKIVFTFQTAISTLALSTKMINQHLRRGSLLVLQIGIVLSLALASEANVEGMHARIEHTGSVFGTFIHSLSLCEGVFYT